MHWIRFDCCLILSYLQANLQKVEEYQKSGKYMGKNLSRLTFYHSLCKMILCLLKGEINVLWKENVVFAELLWSIPMQDINVLFVAMWSH